MSITASRIESPLVKSLHPIHEIAARVSRVDGNCVRLTCGPAADGDLPELAVVAEVVSPADPTEATVVALAAPLIVLAALLTPRLRVLAVAAAPPVFAVPPPTAELFRPLLLSAGPRTTI